MDRGAVNGVFRYVEVTQHESWYLEVLRCMFGLNLFPERRVTRFVGGGVDI